MIGHPNMYSGVCLLEKLLESVGTSGPRRNVMVMVKYVVVCLCH